MFRALLKLHIHLKVRSTPCSHCPPSPDATLQDRVLDLSYAYGYFVADHSLYVILICFGVFLLSL